MPVVILVGVEPSPAWYDLSSLWMFQPDVVELSSAPPGEVLTRGQAVTRETVLRTIESCVKGPVTPGSIFRTGAFRRDAPSSYGGFGMTLIRMAAESPSLTDEEALSAARALVVVSRDARDGSRECADLARDALTECMALLSGRRWPDETIRGGHASDGLLGRISFDLPYEMRRCIRFHLLRAEFHGEYAARLTTRGTRDLADREVGELTERFLDLSINGRLDLSSASLADFRRAGESALASDDGPDALISTFRSSDNRNAQMLALELERIRDDAEFARAVQSMISLLPVVLGQPGSSWADGSPMDGRSGDDAGNPLPTIERDADGSVALRLNTVRMTVKSSDGLLHISIVDDGDGPVERR